MLLPTKGQLLCMCRVVTKKQRAHQHKLPSVMRKWRLVRVTELQPEDKLAHLNENRQWATALELADAYQLPKDDTYK